MTRIKSSLLGKARLLQVVQVACMLFWVRSIYRVEQSAAARVPFGFFQSERADVHWLASALAMTLAAVVILVVVRMWPRMDALMRRMPAAIVPAAVLCGAGSWLVLYRAQSVALLTAGGALCGVGAVLLLLLVCASFAGQSRSEVVSNFLLAFMVLVVLSGTLLLAPRPAVSAITLVCPVIVFAAAIPLRANGKAQSRTQGDELVAIPRRRVSFKRQLGTCVCIAFFGSLFACITGFKMDSFSAEHLLGFYLGTTLSSYLLAALTLFAVQRLVSIDMLPFACLTVQAAAWVFLPFLAESYSGYFIAFVLNGASDPLGQVLMVFAVMYSGPRAGESGHFDAARVLIAVAILGLTAVGAAYLGGVIYHFVGLRSSSIAVVGIIMMYLLLLASSIMRKGDSIEVTVSGGAESEGELARARTEIIASQHPTITAREKDVLPLLLRGRNSASIAEALYVSDNTVKSHVQHIYRKLGIHSRQELLDLASGIEVIRRG